MDGPNFDDLSRRVGASLSRRRAFWTLGGGLGSLLPLLPGALTEAGKKKKKRKKKKGEKCGPVRCSLKQFCCDDLRGVCCTKKRAACCNAAPGTGSCCSKPNDCGKPWGNTSAPDECCPPQRQWFTRTGEMLCCPEGTRSLGTGITSDDGPCCPEEKYCSTEPTGGKCCGDLAPVCLDKSTGRCCTEDAACGDTCCSGMFGDCCGGQCRLSEMGPWTECGNLCCPRDQTCCSNGGQTICCDPGDVCPAPCPPGLPIACCTPAAYANGQCCDNGDGGGG